MNGRAGFGLSAATTGGMVKTMGNGTTLTASRASETPARAALGVTALPRRAFERWRKAAHAIGVVQTRGLMVLMYAFMVLPMGLLARLSRDPLQLRPPENGNWHECKQSPRTIETARRQS